MTEASRVFVIVRGDEAWCNPPFSLKDVIKIRFEWPERRWDADTRMWVFATYVVPDLVKLLRRNGVSCSIVNERAAPVRVQADWAASMFAALTPELGEQAYRALSRVLHPDAGGDGRQQQVLNDAWSKARPKVGAR